MLKPLICVPLLGASFIDLQDQFRILEDDEYDLVEIRIDYYKHLENMDAVHTFLDKCRELNIKKPVIMTYRSISEGGLGVLNQDDYLDLMMHLCTLDYVTYIDIEFSSESFLQLVNYCSKHKLVIASKHYFNMTPSVDENMAIFNTMSEAKVDIMKLAMMPKNNDDVLKIFHLTNKAYSMFTTNIIVIGMGELGMATRIMGGQFGSYITYASGVQSSAPGQIDYKEMKEIYSKIYK